MEDKKTTTTSKNTKTEHEIYSDETEKAQQKRKDQLVETKHKVLAKGQLKRYRDRTK